MPRATPGRPRGFALLPGLGRHPDVGLAPRARMLLCPDQRAHQDPAARLVCICHDKGHPHAAAAGLSGAQVVGSVEVALQGHALGPVRWMVEVPTRPTSLQRSPRAIDPLTRAFFPANHWVAQHPGVCGGTHRPRVNVHVGRTPRYGVTPPAAPHRHPAPSAGTRGNRTSLIQPRPRALRPPVDSPAGCEGGAHPSTCCPPLGLAGPPSGMTHSQLSKPFGSTAP